MINRKLIEEFLKFGIVGFIGFLVDSGVLLFCTSVLGTDPYSGRVCSFVIAVSTTWFCNRVFTFRGKNSGSIFSQWLKFVIACSGGYALNYITYALLVANVDVVAQNLVLGVAAGSVAGMFFNFFTTRKAVFK